MRVARLRQNTLEVVVALCALSFVVYGFALTSRRAVAHSSTASATPSKKAPTSSKTLHEADHYLQAAVYTTTGGWSSSLLLLNAEGKAVTAHVTLYNKHGRSLNVPKITLEPYKSRSWNVADWIGDTEGFEEGSLTVLYNGLSMGLHAQETVTNRERSLSFDVHLEDAMEFMSSTVDGLWWELDDRSDAKVFISNTKPTETAVTPTFYVDGLAHQDKQIVLKGHASDSIDIGKELKELHLSATLGGISFTYTNGPGAISVVGVISSNHRGFSTTMRFVDHMMGATTSLHGANVMIGRPASNPGFPSTARFTPHVIVRNVTAQPVQVNGRIRFTLFDQPNTTELIPVTIAANEVRELDLNPAMNAIGDNAVDDAGIEIDYTGQPGALMAYGSSVDQTGTNAFDVPIKDPMEMMFKGGANPWKIDGNNRAVLHVKNVDHPDGKKREFTVTLYYDGGVYNLPVQSVEAGQTAEIDIRKVRDDQVEDSTGNVIPRDVTRGQLSWYPVAKKGEFIGRLVQYNPDNGTSSSFSCSEPCWCGPDYDSSWLVPGSFNGVPGDVFQVRALAVYVTCNGWPRGPYAVNQAQFYTDDPFVADIIYPNYVILTGGGSTTVTGYWDDFVTEGEYCNQWDDASGWCTDPVCPQATVTPTPQAQVNSSSVDIKLNGNTVTNQTVNVIVGQEMHLTLSVQPPDGTVTNSHWTVPGTDSDRIANWNVMPPPANANNPTTATVANLQSLTNSEVDFYWVTRGDGRTVQYTGNVNDKPVQAQVTFNVQRPTAEIRVVTSTSTTIDSNSGNLEMHLGVPPADGSPPGLAFSRTLQMPSGFSSASTQWVQVLSKFNGGTDSFSFQRDGLDEVYPYDSHSSTTDSPGMKLYICGCTSMYADYTATMYLMFKPGGVTGNSQWVPLRAVTWSWSASAVFLEFNWIDEGHSDPHDLSDSETITYPTWQRNAQF